MHDRVNSRTTMTMLALAALLALPFLAPGRALADDHGRAARVPLLPAYVQECGSCHVAYPPGLLPAASWGRLMSGLDRHFGTDASVDAAAAAEIGADHERYSASGKRARGASGGLRITESAWFVHEHDEVPAAVWTRPAVKSPANCAACHRGAEQGDFDEDRVRIPR